MSGSVAALFQRLTQGVYLVGVAHAERRNVFTAAWVMQVSFGPMLLALSINPRNSSYALLQEGRAFAVNVLKTSSARSGRAVRAAGPCRHIAFGRVDNQRSRPALAARGAGLVRMRNRGRVPCRRSRAGGGQGDRWQAAETPKPSPCPIAKPERWTAHLRCFPMPSPLHEVAHKRSEAISPAPVGHCRQARAAPFTLNNNYHAFQCLN